MIVCPICGENVLIPHDPNLGSGYVHSAAPETFGRLASSPAFTDTCVPHMPQQTCWPGTIFKAVPARVPLPPPPMPPAQRPPRPPPPPRPPKSSQSVGRVTTDPYEKPSDERVYTQMRSVHVSVRRRNGNTLRFRASSGSKIEQLRRRIAKRIGVPTSVQYLHFRERKLRGGRQFSHYGIKGGSVLYLYIKDLGNLFRKSQTHLLRKFGPILEKPGPILVE